VARVETVEALRNVAGRKKLSVIVTTFNEEINVAECLESVLWADEILLVDSFSSDRTVEIAESLGARVLHHEWDGDFSAARNVSFAAAKSDWVMYLDADEVLVATKGGHLRPGDGSWTIDSSPKHLREACEASLKRLGDQALVVTHLVGVQVVGVGGVDQRHAGVQGRVDGGERAVAVGTALDRHGHAAQADCRNLDIADAAGGSGRR